MINRLSLEEEIMRSYEVVILGGDHLVHNTLSLDKRVVKGIFVIREWPIFSRELWNVLFLLSRIVILLETVHRKFPK